MDKNLINIAKALGMNPDNEDLKAGEIAEKAIDKISSESDLKQMNERLVEKLQEKTKNFNLAIEATEQQQVNNLVKEAQDETGHHLGGEHQKQAKSIAKKVVRASDEDDKQDKKNYLKTYCYAHGKEIDIQKKLNEITSKKDSVDSIDESEPNADVNFLSKKYRDNYNKNNSDQISLEDSLNYVLDNKKEVADQFNIKLNGE